MLTTEALLRIGKEVGAQLSSVETTVSLLEGGATVPFIARYRKEATGNLDEVKIRDIDESRSYYSALEDRRTTVLSSIERQGKLTEELRQKIVSCFSKSELEDLYLPFKLRRKTKASSAMERGLGPLADYIWDQVGSEPVEIYAQQFIGLPAAEIKETAEVPEAQPEPEALAAPESAESGVDQPAAQPVAEGLPEVPIEETAESTATADTPEIQPVAEAVAVPENVESAVEQPAAQAVESAPVAEDPPQVTAEETAEISQRADMPEVEPAAAAVVAVAESGVSQPAKPAPVAVPPQVPKRATTVEEAIQGALYILAERIAENPVYRKRLREQLMTEGVVKAHVLPGKESEKTKYEMYYKFEEAVPRIPSHRMLAIRRGSRENILAFSVEGDAEKIISFIRPQVIRDPASQFAPLLERAIRDSYERLMAPSIQNEVRSVLRDRSESEAIDVFQENLRTLLLAPPAGPIGVVGMDPGLRTGCKVAVVDETGKFLENQTIYPTEPRKDVEGAEKTLLELIQKYNVRGLAIGNGTASRETDAFVRSIVQKHSLNVFVIVVSEAGASVYSASRRAREEFPALDVTVRGAISIARRLQDPLAELVKVEPRSIGVGQYQHDVDQKKLKRSLASAVESCVNRVGVDLNMASEDLLKYVSGINDRLASGIVAFRNKSGAFRSRAQLLEVEGFGERTFEQAAGFLRVKDGENPLDRTAVHPESYPLVQRMAESLGIAVQELIDNVERVKSVDFKAFEAEAGKFTVSDIREELLRPGRDPREKFVVPKFRDDVKEVVDLKEGMELEGSVTNVTNFGAFVDLGVHQDGLVHISELSHKYIQDAREAVRVGDIVKVKVIGIDPAMKRISLSMKALLPKPQRRPRRKPKAPEQSSAPAAQARAATPAPVEAPRRPARPAAEQQQRRAAAPSAPPRPARPPRPENRQQQPPKPPRPPVETMAPASKQTMEEKIRALQEKFGHVN